MKANSLKRGIIIAVAVLLISALAFCIFTGLNSRKCGLLPDFERASEKLERYDFEWYKEICSTMINKKDEADKENISQEYILSKGTSFLGRDFINIKIFSDQTGEMIRKFQNEEIVNKKGISYDEKITLNKEQTSEIVKLIEDNRFWKLKYNRVLFGADGGSIFIEGVSGDKYNMIYMWQPDDTYEIYKIYKGVIDCAEKWGLNADYYYLSYGIPKEHFNQDMY